MPTVDDIAQQALHAVGSSAGIIAAGGWVTNRYRRLAQRQKMPHLRRFGELQVPAAIETGTVSLTEGSQLVTGDATAQAAWALVGDELRSRFFRLGTSGQRTWHEIEAWDGTNLRLTTPWLLDDVADSAYTVAARYLDLNPSAVIHAGYAADHSRYGTGVGADGT